MRPLVIEAAHRLLPHHPVDVDADELFEALQCLVESGDVRRRRDRAVERELKPFRPLERQLPSGSLVLEGEDLDVEEPNVRADGEHAEGRPSGVEETARVAGDQMVEAPGLEQLVRRHVRIALVGGNHTDHLVPAKTPVLSVRIGRIRSIRTPRSVLNRYFLETLACTAASRSANHGCRVLQICGFSSLATAPG